jgi:hypothetical protein
MADQLPGWTDGPAKAQILEFVRSVTEPGASFVPAADRIAAFDGDGTLWCERPISARAEFLLRRWKEIAQAHPSTARQQPWKAIAEGDMGWLAAFLDRLRADQGRGGGLRGHYRRGVREGRAGVLRYRASSGIRCSLHQARLPPYARTDCPAEGQGVRVYICPPGGRDFVRVISEDMYGIPRQAVIGSGAALEYRHGKVYRTKGVEQPADDGPGKPVHIWTRTGRKPLLAGGNADGDAAMLRRPVTSCRER